MQPRKSRPHIQHVPKQEFVDEAPTVMTAPMKPLAAPNNVLPFARPRAIASMPATFTKPAGPSAPPHIGSWNVKPHAAAAAPAAMVLPMPVAKPPVVAPPPAPVAPPIHSAPAAPPVQMFAPMQATYPVAPKHDATIVSPPPQMLAPTHSAPSKWAAFEKLGLIAPKLKHHLEAKKLSKHVVTAYRMLGFGILTIIVFVLIGYIATTAFFYMSDSWIVPTAISPHDDKVVALEAQLAERQNNRDRIAADLEDANRAITMQQAFQGEFAKAIQSDLTGRKAALERMHQLANAAASTRASIRSSNNAFAAASQRRMAEEFKAGLIDRQSMLSGKFQLAQISTSNLSLAERQAEYEVRAADLESQTRSLEALLAHTAADAPISYDVLKIKQEYESSRLSTDKAIGLRDALKVALEREDKLLDNLKHTGYLRALADHAQVAFVPYGNLHTIDKGTKLYSCRVGMIFCHKVGTVLEVLPGEVVFKHPHREKNLRGQMVELQLEDGAAATDDVLFVGGKPLLF